MSSASNKKHNVRLALIAALCLATAVSGQTEEPATAGADVISTDAYDALVRDLLLRIDLIEMEKGNVSGELLTPLFELGKLYVSGNECKNAIPIIQRAILLSQRQEGLMNPRQLTLYEPMLECYVALDLIRDLGRAQDQMLLVNESAFGKDDMRMLPALRHGAEWYQQAGLYDEARQLYSRATKIVRKAAGENDERMVDPLRGMAETFRLEAQYESRRSSALNAAGERTLQQAAAIVRANPDSAPERRVDTLLELADWYQMSGAVRDAIKVYKEVWAVAQASGQSVTDLLGEPYPILYRARLGIALRHPPPDREKLQHYFVDFHFTVTRMGEVRDVVVVDSGGAPRYLQMSLSTSLKSTHYRPRFVNGEPVDTPNITLRQGVWVGK